MAKLTRPQLVKHLSLVALDSDATEVQLRGALNQAVLLLRRYDLSGEERLTVQKARERIELGLQQGAYKAEADVPDEPTDVEGPPDDEEPDLEG